MVMAFGVPDDRMVRLAAISPDGTPQLGLPGSLALLPYLSRETQSRLQKVLVTPDGPLPWPTQSKAVVNCITDADVCAHALSRLGDVVKSAGLPCFNHPHAVAESTREKIAARLTTVPAVRMPRTVRITLDDPCRLAAVVEEAGMQFPVIVRTTGSHGGTTTRKIDTPADAAVALAKIPWGGRPLYVTEYVEYGSPDGLHRKMRVVVVGQEIFLRHLVASRGWHVHAEDREGSIQAEEEDALARFPVELLPRLGSPVKRIAQVLELDYFGIDCSLLADGTLLVFEANAAMNVLLNPAPSPNCWETPVRQIRDAVEALLSAPERWIHRGNHP